MRRLIISGIVALGCIGVAEAQEAKTVQCQKNADVRTVTVESTAGGCRVLYSKPAKSPGRELWRYKAHPDMCQSRAQQFVTKLEGMGLTCGPQP
ncbi:MAG TPA: hypothetical protein VN823_04615 [Stellaceae bacterium]|nr:hypothetical protein [Stellaceae bacterium]